MKIKLAHKFEDIVSTKNLLLAWKEFLRDKRNRFDVQEFSFSLIDNILSLNNELVKKNYRHGGYEAFKINDPKPRDIHKASVRDRLLHHSIYRILYPYFDRKFICDSYSCRLKKGAHKAINRFQKFYYKVSKNNTRTCWVLKCDIKKFFANINHKILKSILENHISDKDILWLFSQVIDSFHMKGKIGIGLPLGNLTSQLLVNIYMNEFDQFVKHKLKIKYYIRYADDFAIFNKDKNYLESIIPKISEFLEIKLKLSLHPDKVFIKTVASGVDFLGWINFSDHMVLRNSTKKRMMKRIRLNPVSESINSYLGLLSHGNTYKIKEKIFKQYFSG